jgi:hypothetical protein
MLRLQALRILRLIALSGLLLGMRALAQFEVAPDHFDSALNKNTANKRAKSERAATTHPGKVSVTPGSAVQAGQSGGGNASRAAQRRQPRRNLRRRADHPQVAAAHRNHNAEEPSVAVSPQ